jgi:excisionase family DNA binding protein
LKAHSPADEFKFVADGSLIGWPPASILVRAQDIANGDTSMNGVFEKHGLTIHEAYITSSIGRTKLYEAINSGELKAHKAGKRTLILSDDLRDYLSSLPLMVRAAEES